MVTEFFVKIAFVIMLPFAIMSVGFDIGKTYVEFIVKGNLE